MRFSKPRKLNADDKIAGFDCDEPAINEWIQKRGLSSMKQRTAVVYATFDDNKDLAGFYSLSAHSVDRTLTSGWLKRNTPSNIPVFLLGMLGIDRKYQGQGLGSELLLDAYHRASSASEVIGARAIVVDPLNDAARQFYLSKGFEQIGSTDRLFARFQN